MVWQPVRSLSWAVGGGDMLWKTGLNVYMYMCAAGSKSDGQKSPSDSVFLRMDEIPYIREDRAEADTHTGTTSDSGYVNSCF